MLKFRSFLILFLFIIVTPQAKAQGTLYGGFGLGRTGAAGDRSFSVNSRTFQIPLIGYNMNYSSVGFPIIMYENEASSNRYEFGINGITLVHSDHPEELKSATLKEVTTYEVNSTTLYADYVWTHLFFELIRGHFFVGPTIVETVFTDAKELYDTSGGSDEFKGVSKEYEIDYGLGATAGFALGFQFLDSFEFIAQLRHFHHESSLSLPDGTKINSGSTQGLFIILGKFD